MKQIGLLTLTILFFSLQVQAQAKKAKDEMAFDKTVGGITSHDFGSIVYGANGKVDFTYTNNSTKPLIITEVKSSCGCTVPTWTKEPVAPGQKGTISVVYNTTLPGPFNKTIEVISNAGNSPVRISIMGKVNSQPSDLKPTKSNVAGTPDQKVRDSETNQAIVPQDSASKASAAAVSKAQKSAQEESFKKLLEQKPGTPKTATPQTATPPVKQSTTPVRRK
jgi:hypothetical protein